MWTWYVCPVNIHWTSMQSTKISIKQHECILCTFTGSPYHLQWAFIRSINVHKYGHHVEVKQTLRLLRPCLTLLPGLSTVFTIYLFFYSYFVSKQLLFYSLQMYRSLWTFQLSATGFEPKIFWFAVCFSSCYAMGSLLNLIVVVISRLRAITNTMDYEVYINFHARMISLILFCSSNPFHFFVFRRCKERKIISDLGQVREGNMCVHRCAVKWKKEKMSRKKRENKSLKSEREKHKKHVTKGVGWA